MASLPLRNRAKSPHFPGIARPGPVFNVVAMIAAISYLTVRLKYTVGPRFLYRFSSATDFKFLIAAASKRRVHRFDRLRRRFFLLLLLFLLEKFFQNLRGQLGRKSRTTGYKLSKLHEHNVSAQPCQ